MLGRSRCGSRLPTPEQGFLTWATCVKGDGHRGDHKAPGYGWSTAEAMHPEGPWPRALAEVAALGGMVA